MKAATDMQVGPEMVYSDVCSMLLQLHQLESCNANDGTSTVSLIDRVNSAMSKLPPNSPLHAQWHKTRSQYEETTTKINLNRSDLVAVRNRLAPDDKDSRERVETPPCCSSDNISNRSLIQQQSGAGNNSPPVCHVKPTQVVNETSSSPSTAPFNLRNYLIDKNAPVTEPVFKPQVTSPVQGSTVKSSEIGRRRSYDDVAPVDVRCKQPVTASAKSTLKPAATALPPMRSRWKELKKKAAGLFSDGLGSGRAVSQSDRCSPRKLNVSSVGTERVQRLESTCYSTFNVKSLTFC